MFFFVLFLQDTNTSYHRLKKHQKLANLNIEDDVSDNEVK